MSQLDEVIEAQMQDVLLDSQGSFSLSLAEAWRKMGENAATHPLQWVVTCIQAFCAAQASAVYLVHKNAEIWLVAHHGNFAHSPEQFLVLSAEHLLTQTPAGLLGRTLASLLCQQPERLLLCSWSEPRRSPEVADFASAAARPAINPMLPSSGPALALYFKGTARIPELNNLLGYLLQYCPIPVHYVAHGMILKSDTDVRSLHWIQQPPNCPLYSGSQQTSVSTPLLMDYYGSESGPQLLLKPPCGDDLSYYADWQASEGDFAWLRNPGLFDGTSSQARYYQGCSQPVQSVSYDASKVLGNSWFSERGTRRVTFLSGCGDLIVMLESKGGPDRILPVLHGTTLICLEGLLNIPGLVVVAGARGLHCDLGGVNLVRDSQFQAWIQQLRVRVMAALQGAVQQPPQARGRLSVLKTAVATGATAAVTLCLDGIQPEDFKMLLGCAGLGGAAIYTCLGFVRHYAPDSWLERQSRDLQSELRRRLELGSKDGWQGPGSAGA